MSWSLFRTAPSKRPQRTARCDLFPPRIAIRGLNCDSFQAHGWQSVATASAKYPMSQNSATAQGVLELHPKGYGFLRDPAKSYFAQPGDAYVPGQPIKKDTLHEGGRTAGAVGPGKEGSVPR